MPDDDEMDDLERALGKVHADGRGGGVREERKTESEVWDRLTLDAIYRFMKRGLIDTVEFPISTGKEANIFYALDPEGGPLVVKVYRTATADFKGIDRYILGDPRFPRRRSTTRDIIYTWARKEYLNLRMAHEAGVPVPEPREQFRNVLAMEYVGDEERPAPELRHVRLRAPRRFLEEVLDACAALYEGAGLVHGDLSEYNILVRDGHPVLIDLGQAMLLRHPRSPELLARDVNNLARYFQRLGIKTSDDECWRRITGSDREAAGKDGGEKA